jgi:hypothetical protein
MLRLVCLLAVATCVACAHEPELKPAPDAKVLPGRKDVAMQTVAGVRVEVAGDAWKGNPSNLAEVLIPVRVSIENQSGRPLRLRYSEFTLIGENGFHYSVLPPFQIRGAVGSSAAPGQIVPAAAASPPPPIRPRFLHRGFWVAPPLARFYVGLPPWPDPFLYDPFYYDRWYVSWPVELPTRDMLEQALPEGVVENGGAVSGFLYFDPSARRENRVVFEMQLVDARDGSGFGKIDIPFLVKK